MIENAFFAGLGILLALFIVATALVTVLSIMMMWHAIKEGL